MDQNSISNFESHLRKQDLQPETIRAYCADVRQYFEWLAAHGNETPFAIGTDDAQEYVNFLASPIHTLRPGKIGAYSASTIARKVKTLRYFYDFLNTSI